MSAARPKQTDSDRLGAKMDRPGGDALRNEMLELHCLSYLHANSVHVVISVNRGLKPNLYKAAHK
jgi:hypothetical protein